MSYDQPGKEGPGGVRTREMLRQEEKEEPRPPKPPPPSTDASGARWTALAEYLLTGKTPGAPPPPTLTREDVSALRWTKQAEFIIAEQKKQAEIEKTREEKLIWFKHKLFGGWDPSEHKPGAYDIGGDWIAVVDASGNVTIMTKSEWELMWGSSPEKALGLGLITEGELSSLLGWKEQAFQQWKAGSIFNLLWAKGEYEEALGLVLQWRLISETEYKKELEGIMRFRGLEKTFTSLNKLAEDIYGVELKAYGLGLTAFELTAKMRGPEAAMLFGREIGLVSPAEIKEWKLEQTETQKTYLRLWKEDPNKALAFLLGKGFITEKQYQERYLHPTFTESLERGAREFLGKGGGITGPLFPERKPFVMGDWGLRVGIGMGLGAVGEVESIMLLGGRLLGFPQAYEVKPLPTGMTQVALQPFFGPEGWEGITIPWFGGPVTLLKGLRLPKWETKEQRTWEQYVSRVKEFPGIPVGEAFIFWTETKAVGWGLKQFGRGAKWVGGKIAETKVGEALEKTFYKVFEPTRVPVWEKISAMKYRLPGFIQEKFWPIEYGRRHIEKGITWGEEAYMWVSGAELSETLSKTWKYTGYPVIYGEKAGYKILKAGEQLTAFQQIQKAIEMGKFQAWGGLSTQQILLFEKPVTMMAGWEQARYLSLALAGAPAKAPSWITSIFAGGGLVASAKALTSTLAPSQLTELPLLKPFELEKIKFKPLELMEPKYKEREKLGFIPRWFELEKIKFQQLQFLEPKLETRQRGFLITAVTPMLKAAQIQWQAQITAQTPTLKQLQKQLQLQLPKLEWPPYHFPPTPGIPPIPWFFKAGWPPGFQLPRGKGFWGGWFKREHPIKTWQQMLKSFGLTTTRIRRGKVSRTFKPSETTRVPKLEQMLRPFGLTYTRRMKSRVSKRSPRISYSQMPKLSGMTRAFFGGSTRREKRAKTSYSLPSWEEMMRASRRRHAHKRGRKR